MFLFCFRVESTKFQSGCQAEVFASSTTYFKLNPSDASPSENLCDTPGSKREESTTSRPRVDTVYVQNLVNICLFGSNCARFCLAEEAAWCGLRDEVGGALRRIDREHVRDGWWLVVRLHHCHLPPPPQQETEETTHPPPLPSRQPTCLTVTWSSHETHVVWRWWRHPRWRPSEADRVGQVLSIVETCQSRLWVAVRRVR